MHSRPPATGFPAPAPVKSTIEQYRKSGRYLFEFHGKTEECGSLKESLKKSLIAIEQAKPGMLAELTKIKPRTRRIVAKDPKDLFTDQKLVKQFAETLMPGWYTTGPTTARRRPRRGSSGLARSPASSGARTSR